MGYISQCLPLYHPLMTQELLRILKCVCPNCQMLKLSRPITFLFNMKLKLIRAGFTAEASEIFERPFQYLAGGVSEASLLTQKSLKNKRNRVSFEDDGITIDNPEALEHEKEEDFVQSGIESLSPDDMVTIENEVNRLISEKSSEIGDQKISEHLRFIDISSNVTVFGALQETFKSLWGMIKYKCPHCNSPYVQHIILYSSF